MAGKDLVKRGIYAPKWLDASGHRVLVAVDSRGRAVHSCRVFASDDCIAIVAMMRRWLDREDPKGGRDGA
jgi:hypothetical protein